MPPYGGKERSRQRSNPLPSSPPPPSKVSSVSDIDSEFDLDSDIMRSSTTPASQNATVPSPLPLPSLPSTSNGHNANGQNGTAAKQFDTSSKMSVSSSSTTTTATEITTMMTTTASTTSTTTDVGIVEDTVDFGCDMVTTTAAASTTPNANNATFTETGAASDVIEFIDNTALTYIPIRLACGTICMCSPQTLAVCPMILRSLQIDIIEALKVLPRSVHELVTLKTTIWINVTYEYGDVRDPYVLHHSTTHHTSTWLTNVAHDVPHKARSIEIYNCFEYERMRYHWNGCGLLLHEFCHIIHQHCVDDGLDNTHIDDLFQTADQSGLYECVLRRDWAGRMIQRSAGVAVPSSSSASTSSSFVSVSSSSVPSSPPASGGVSSPTTTTTAHAESEQGLTISTDIDNDIYYKHNNINNSNRPVLELADSDLAYAMVDKKEFFAEMSVTYLANSYKELDNGDCRHMEECCPPILEQSVLSRAIQYQETYQPRQPISSHLGTLTSSNPYSDNDDPSVDDYSCWAGFFQECQKLIALGDAGRRRLLFLPESSSSSSSNVNNNEVVSGNAKSSSQLPTMVNLQFHDNAIRQNCANVKHCNKFYPFTRGQLQRYDPELYEGIRMIWKEITSWKDNEL